MWFWLKQWKSACMKSRTLVFTTLFNFFLSLTIKPICLRSGRYSIWPLAKSFFSWHDLPSWWSSKSCPRYVRLGICKAEFLRLLSRYKLIEIWLQLHRRVNVLYQRLHFGITIITVKFNGALFLNGGKNLVGIIVASIIDIIDLLLTISYRGTLVLIIYLTNY